MPHKKDHKIRVEDLFWQSPIPQPRSELTDEEFEAIFKERAREYREGLLDTVPEKPKKGGSALDWLISQAGASGLVPQEKENLFNAGFGDLEHEVEVVRDPVSKLGYNADVGRAVGLGISQRAGQGFTRQGQYYWGSDVEPEKTDLAAITESMGYSTREFWGKYKGRMKTGMSYDDWLATGKAIGEAREVVMINLHAHRRGSAQLWAHEYGHRGQRLAHDLELSDALKTREHKEIREAIQDMRDVLYANTNRVSEFHKQAEEIAELSEEEFDLIYDLVLEEDKLANEKLMSQGRSPGPEPDMQPYLDWVEGGKTVEGYKKARRKRVTSTWGQEQSGILGLWNKTMGLFD